MNLGNRTYQAVIETPHDHPAKTWNTRFLIDTTTLMIHRDDQTWAKACFEKTDRSPCCGQRGHGPDL